MNIKQIVDKIVKEADVSPAQYTVADRIVDVNEKYLILIEKAVQIGSTVPISKAETFSETFVITQTESQTLVRTIKDTPIQRVDFMQDGATQYQKVEVDQTRSINGWCGCGLKFFANEKQIFIEDGQVGTIRITYTRGDIVLFTEADYNNVTPPSPDWLPETYHPLLWLEPALFQAQLYKPERVSAIASRLNQLQGLFFNHYGRDAVQNSAFETKEYGCGTGNNQR